MSEESLSRRDLTFEQAEGKAALPTQLDRNQLPQVLRARLWHALYNILKSSVQNYGLVSGNWQNALSDLYVRKFGVFSDKILRTLEFHVRVLKPIFEEQDAEKLYGTTEWLVRKSQWSEFPDRVGKILIEERSAFRLIDRHDIVPFASKFEGDALLGVLGLLKSSGLDGPRIHLKKAANALAHGEFADSVRESIHSIESASRLIAPSASFSDAMAKIETAQRIHPAFKKGLLALYGYSSDEKGIRHPLLENGDAAVRAG